MSEPKFTGVWIPAGVFQRADLSMSAKLLYGVVAGLDGSDGCYASNAYLQRFLGLSERSIQAVLKELDVANLIKREDFNGNRIIRTVESIALSTSFADSQVTRFEDGCNKLRGEVQKTAGGGRRKLHPYNKEDNKEDKDTKEMPWITELPFNSEQFKKAWSSWIVYRKEIRKPIKESTMKAQCREFLKWGEQKSIISIEMSIKNGWQGLFEPARSQSSNTKTLTKNDHEEF